METAMKFSITLCYYSYNDIFFVYFEEVLIDKYIINKK